MIHATLNAPNAVLWMINLCVGRYLCVCTYIYDVTVGDFFYLFCNFLLFFFCVQERGVKHFKEVEEEQRAKSSVTIPGKAAFFLYDSMGFPLDLTQVMAQEVSERREKKIIIVIKNNNNLNCDMIAGSC